MNAYPISNRIKNPRVNDPDLLKPTGPLVFPEKYIEYKTNTKLVGMGHGKRDKRDNSWKPTMGEVAANNKKDEQK